MKKKLNFGRRKWLMATFRASPSCGHYNETFPSFLVYSVNNWMRTHACLNHSKQNSHCFGQFRPIWMSLIHNRTNFPAKKRGKLPGHAAPRAEVPVPAISGGLFGRISGNKIFYIFLTSGIIGPHLLRGGSVE